MTDTLRIAIIILEPIGGDMSRAYRGLKTALEFQKAGDDVAVLFDGSGVETLAAISDSGSPLNPLITALRDSVLGACSFCATSHKVADAILDAGWALRAENDGEASVRDLLVEGRQILTF